MENQQRIWKSFPLWLVYHAVGYYILMFKIYILVKTDVIIISDTGEDMKSTHIT